MIDIFINYCSFPGNLCTSIMPDRFRFSSIYSNLVTNTSYTCCIFLLSFFSYTVSFGQGDAFESKAYDLIDKAVKDDECVGIAAGFSINGEIKWCDAAGFRNADSKIAFDTATITRIASITKTMTAVAIMQLYEQGKLRLDEPIQTYLPNFPKKKEGEITIRNLLEHSSGIDGYKNAKEQENKIYYPTLSDAVSIFKDRDLVAAPGKTFHYSTYGYVLLGLIIEKVSGMRFASYLKANIWERAQMSKTGIESGDNVLANKSSLYHKNSRGKISAADITDLSDRVPGGGVYSTVTDSLKFGDAVLNSTLIKESTFKMMVENSNLKKEGNGYGLGWYLYGKNPDYGYVYGHNGSQTGASTFLMLLPEYKTTVVVLSNTSGAMQTVTDITIRLFDIAGEVNE